jgi:hypothetical protein
MSDANRSQRTSTSSVEAVAAQMKVGLPTAYKILSGVGSTASTVILILLSALYSEFRAEWAAVKADVAAVRRELDTMPTPEEYQRIYTRIDDLTERLIVVESRCYFDPPHQPTPRLRGAPN